jgi:acrylyl-CoA reductase (NADPH)
LESERWAGAIDAVGGAALPGILPQLRYRGAVAACGNAGGNDLATSVLPFLLRGVRIIGIDSVACPLPERQAAWARLATAIPTAVLDAMTTVIPLADLPAAADRILAGQVRGRIVVDVAA